ncbi:uncharacterized protein LOC114073940 [Solanum pennellii]|uniref:Uncharacterized protein LOC114073940 n=1 Tax=Solanum pennellii TaxID=28526 RepID=A0ABM1VGD1_SOLPN|nr:uncharacterized protein LOC114073940 [Solanum pennellii]
MVCADMENMYINTIATSLMSEIPSYDVTALKDIHLRFLVVLGVQKGLFLHLANNMEISTIKWSPTGAGSSNTNQQLLLTR